METKTKIIVFLLGAVGLIGSHGFVYFKGRSDGKTITEAKVIEKIVTVREKQNEILIHRPDADATIRRLFNSSF